MGRLNHGVSNPGFAGMAVGETRTVQFNCGPKTITRTKRDFIHDWVDATNDDLVRRGRGDVRWRVNSMGEAQLYSVRYARGLA